MITYHKPIKKRDKDQCFLCNNTDNLHVHHIKTVGSWWIDEYINLITLCFECHIMKAHWKKKAYYREIFEEYTSQFTRPIDWDQVMEESRKAKDKYKKYKNQIQKRKYTNIKEKIWWETQHTIEANSRQKAYRKEMRQKYQEEFKKEHNWLSTSQWQYRNQKKYLQDQLLLWK